MFPATEHPFFGLRKCCEYNEKKIFVNGPHFKKIIFEKIIKSYGNLFRQPLY